MSAIKNADAIITLLSDTIDKELIDNAKNLKIIANYGAGFNNIDVKYASFKKIAVSNTPDVVTRTTAETAFALMIALSRRLFEGQEECEKNKFKGWSTTPLFCQGLQGKTVGIIGYGRIGKDFEKLCKAFDMKIVKHKHKDTRKNLEKLLRESDFVSLHVPLNSETKHMITMKEISLMKKSAYIINTARGPVINEKDLSLAIKNKKIAGAGLDVYEFEPKITKGLLKQKNIICLPHIGAATLDTRKQMLELCVNAIIAVLSGNKPANQIN